MGTMEGWFEGCVPMHDTFHKICRICLTETQLLGVNDVYKNGLTILQMFESATLLKIEEEDGLPKQICQTCLEFLSVTHWFLEQCKTSDLKLRFSLYEAGKLSINLNDLVVPFPEPNLEQFSESAPDLLQTLNVENFNNHEKQSQEIPWLPSSNQETFNNAPTRSNNDFKTNEVPITVTTNNNVALDNKNNTYISVKSKEFLYNNNVNVAYDIEKDVNINFKKKELGSIEESSNLTNLDKKTNIRKKLFDSIKNNVAKNHSNILKNNSVDASLENTKSITATTNVDGRDDETSNSSKEKFNHLLNTWPCRTCGKVFTTADLLSKHKLAHAKEKSFSCEECGKKFGFSKNLSRHKKIHNGKCHVCTACGKSYTTKNLLDEHHRLHTGENPYGCDLCHKKFRTQTAQKNHIRMHQINSMDSITDKEVLAEVCKYQCKVCNKILASKSSFNKHILIHAEKEFFCNDCGKSFSNKSGLLSHARTHRTEKPFKCTYCDKSFRHKTALEQHTNIHKGIKPYQCNDCDMAFVQHHQLIYHSRKHTGERPYSCQECGKSFVIKGNLVIHFRNYHRFDVNNMNMAQ